MEKAILMLYGKKYNEKPAQSAGFFVVFFMLIVEYKEKPIPRLLHRLM